MWWHCKKPCAKSIVSNSPSFIFIISMKTNLRLVHCPNVLAISFIALVDIFHLSNVKDIRIGFAVPTDFKNDGNIGTLPTPSKNDDQPVLTPSFRENDLRFVTFLTFETCLYSSSFPMKAGAWSPWRWYFTFSNFCNLSNTPPKFLKFLGRRESLNKTLFERFQSQTIYPIKWTSRDLSKSHFRQLFINVLISFTLIPWVLFF